MPGVQKGRDYLDSITEESVKQPLPKLVGQSLDRETETLEMHTKLELNLDYVMDCSITGSVEGSHCQITINAGSNISIVLPDYLVERQMLLT